MTASAGDVLPTGAFLDAEAEALDRDDPLRQFRQRFQLPQDIVYLDGNSLGPVPAAATGVMNDAVRRQWGEDLIRSWNKNGWFTAPQRVGGKIAPLLGVAAGEVIVADSVSVNLFKILTALRDRHHDRTQLLSEASNFPTDLHVADGVTRQCGLTLHAEPRETVLDRIGPETAVLCLTHVHYRTGQRYDIREVEQIAACHKVPVLWDLSHSVGAVPLHLGADGASYAVGCGYKYLNGGPGAPAFLYAAADRQQSLRPALQGWMGDARPFDFEDRYRPAAGMTRFLVGTPPVLSLLALECGADQFADVSMDAVWEKSVRMFDFFVSRVTRLCPALELVTPEVPDLRGSHVSFRYADAWPVNNALIERGVIGDFRTPDVLRFGLTPLYTRFTDLARAADTLADILRADAWQAPRFRRPAAVT